MKPVDIVVQILKGTVSPAGSVVSGIRKKWCRSFTFCCVVRKKLENRNCALSASLEWRNAQSCSTNDYLLLSHKVDIYMSRRVFFGRARLM